MSGPLIRALEGRPRPLAVVDLDAFDRNLDRLLQPLGDKTLRVASKSVRCPALLRRVLERPQARGVLTMHAREAALLFEQGLDDLLIAYPPAPEDLPVLAGLVQQGCQLWVTVDGAEMVSALGRVASASGVDVPLCIDVDCSIQLAGAHLGVRRSPIRTPDDARTLAQHIHQTPGVRLNAMLGYEAQIAGVPDQTGSSRDFAVRLMKNRSRSRVLERRAAILAALQAEAEIDVVNGGGTGSVDWSANDPCLTELSAGSGLFCPHTFDGFRGLELEPAAFFALSVVRASDADYVTCYGGGFAASGAAGPDRSPKVHWPQGLEPVSLEGFGEVQTPFRWRGVGAKPAWGSTVLCRHAKAGELTEHFRSLVTVSAGGVEEHPTYRGLGLS